MAKRPRKPAKTYYAPSQGAMRRMQDSLVKYDEAVTKLEMKWGVDRLPWLVGTDLREKFDRQMERLNKAIDDHVDVEHQVDVTMKGLALLERTAIELGHEPLTGEYWEAPMPDGKVLAIVPTDWHVSKVKRENRDMVVYSIDEVAKIIAGFRKDSPMDAVKDVFPGAVVEKVKTETEELLDDELPF